MPLFVRFKYWGHTYTKKSFVVSLKFPLSWAFCTLSPDKSDAPFCHLKKLGTYYLGTPVLGPRGWLEWE